MKSNSRCALQIIIASFFLLMSCDVSTFMSPQQIPTPIPGVVHLMVVQTAAAAATETAALTSSNADTHLDTFSNPNSCKHAHYYADFYFFTVYAN